MRDEEIPGVVVGDEKVVRRGAGPGGVDFDRISDYCHDWDFFVIFEKSFQNVGVEWIGADDEVGLEFIEDISEGGFGGTQKRKRFGKILSVGRVVDQGPKPGSVGGDFPVDITEKAIEFWGADVAWIGNADFVAGGESLGQVSGGGIVSVTETG